MFVEATLKIRREELRRRVEALPSEVREWQDRTQNDLDSNLHFSQLQAIGILVDTFAEQQTRLLDKMDPTGDTAEFQAAAFELVNSVIRSQRVWDFFRDKLDLRFSPTFKEVLWVADTAAWDCYDPVLEPAVDAKILERATKREPPLTYLTAEFSPSTWFRGSRPNDGRDYHLGTSRLPIPVIEVPWDHVKNSWEFMLLHHEVGHDLEADLQLRDVLAASLETELSNGGVPAARINRWLSWQGEVFADLVGLQLGGPAFTEALIHLLLLPATKVTTADPDDPHPTSYLRVLMNAAYIPTMIQDNQPLADHGKQIADRWISIYGNQPQFNELISDFTLVFHALMDTPLPALKKVNTLRELIPYTAADDQRIRNAVGFMRTGMNRPGKLRPRHCISAARLAVTQTALEEALSEDLLNDINQRTLELVRSNAPSGLRAAGDSAPHKKFIASFVEKL